MIAEQPGSQWTGRGEDLADDRTVRSAVHNLAAGVPGADVAAVARGKREVTEAAREISASTGRRVVTGSVLVLDGGYTVY